MHRTTRADSRWAGRAVMPRLLHTREERRPAAGVGRKCRNRRTREWYARWEAGDRGIGTGVGRWAERAGDRRVSPGSPVSRYAYFFADSFCRNRLYRSRRASREGLASATDGITVSARLGYP